ncbi:MAG: pyridoxamine 5'-phosphate oxidase family protein [Bryobacteraceae bacterium]|nr:pyridoxamine 5'-phosphate oxidase family protein [Bryobacteraceae bacterium]
MTHEELHAFISAHPLAVVASQSREGEPQSALVGIAVTSRLELVFDTLKSSRKYANLKSNPACSFVIGCSGDITIQFEGVAEEITDSTPARFRETYFQQWPGGRTRAKWAEITWFVVRPRWLRYSDYGQDPDYIEEMRFDEPISSASSNARA